MFQASIWGVRRLGKWISVLAAVLWLPLTLHCQLESIPGLEYLACPADTSSPGETNSDCGDSGCCAAEHSLYKSEQSRLTIPSPGCGLLASVPLRRVESALFEEVSLGILTAAPPELLKVWHFVFRTASPPRAPSLAS